MVSFGRKPKQKRSIWLPDRSLKRGEAVFVLYEPRALPPAAKLADWLQENVHDHAKVTEGPAGQPAPEGIDEGNWLVTVELPGLGSVIMGDMGAPIPGDEALRAAKNSYIEGEAMVAAARGHTSHVVAAGLAEQPGPELYKLLAWSVAALCHTSPTATAVYTQCGLVTPPKLWFAAAAMASDGTYPVAPFVHVGNAVSPNGNLVKTRGAERFGIRELEIRLPPGMPPIPWIAVAEFLDYALANRGGIDAGHTVGLTPGDAWPISVGRSLIENETVAIIGPPR